MGVWLKNNILFSVFDWICRPTYSSDGCRLRDCKAEVIIWDFETHAVYAKLVLHRNSVEALSFTYNDKYLVSLGGQDDARCESRNSHFLVAVSIFHISYLISSI